MIEIDKKYNKILFQEKLILFAILLTPILGLYELSELLNLNISRFLPGLKALKVSKDLFILIIIICGIFSGFWKKLKTSLICYTFLLIILSISLCISIFYVPFEAIISGIRWISPFIFFLFLGELRLSFYQNLTSWLESIVFVGLILQFFQLYNMNGIYGISLAGFSLRNPGFYLSPSSMSAFSMTTLFFIHNFETNYRKRFIFLIVVTLSVFLTASGSGILSLFLYFLFLIFKKANPYVIIIILVILLSFFVGYLPLITGREDIMDSPLGRIDILVENISLNNFFFSSNFGIATNTFINLRPDLLDSQVAIIADSMINSTIINCGLFFLLILIYILFIKPLYKFRKIGLLYLLINFPFFLSTIIFELYPVNILIFIELLALPFIVDLTSIKKAK
jgi:hypothetical protein